MDFIINKLLYIYIYRGCINIDLFMKAAKHSYVETPFAGFELCVVFCQLVHHTAELSTEQMIILMPCTHTGEPVSNSPILLIASSPNKDTLIPLSVQQAELAIDILSDAITNNNGMEGILDISSLEEARTSLQSIQKPAGTIVNLTEKLSVVLTQNAVQSTPWDMQILLSGILMIPMSFEFIGFRGSNDNIKVNINLVDIPHDDVKSLRLLDDVLFYVDFGNGRDHEYSGVCTKLEVFEGLLVMTIESFAYDLSKTQIGAVSTAGIRPLDLVHLIGRNGGLEEKQLNIEGFHSDSKVYTVAMPILNMEFTESLGFGDVMLYPVGHTLTEIPRIRDVAKENSVVFETNCLAVVNIEADSLYNAFKFGIKKIEQVLDVVLHIIRADTVFKGVASDLIHGSWNLDELTPQPVVSTWVYIEEIFSGGIIVMDTAYIEEPYTLTIRRETQNVLEQMEWYESLLRMLEETGDESLKSLFNAFKWLRRSWDAKDFEDKIIFANIALEFVASGEPSPSIIPKEHTKSVRKAAVDKFKEVFEGEDKDKYVEKLNQKIAESLNSAPLRVLIENLIERSNIPISNADITLIFAGRKIRNDLVHGRSANQTFTKTQNRKMVNAIGIIASHKLRSFLKEGSSL